MKLYLAGLQRFIRQVEKFQPRYILESFAYIKEKEFAELNVGEFLLDSGAFTFLSKKDVVIDWEKYVDNYAGFIRRQNIENFFELDIYKIIGTQPTEALRDRLEQTTGRASIPVWHRHLGLEYLHYLSEKYSYIGFGGFAIKDISPGEYKFIPKLLEICAKNDCRVHGLGFTNQDWLRKCKFYSVDSTSWNGGRFGTLFQFRDGRVHQIKRPEKRIKINDAVEHNFGEWIKMQNFAENHL